MDREMERALELDGEKLRQLTGEDHGPWSAEPDYDSMWNDLISLDDAAREAIERANGGPVYIGVDYPAEYLDNQALMRVLGLISISDHRDADSAARTISLRQAASETPAEFMKRIATALLSEMAGVA